MIPTWTSFGVVHGRRERKPDLHQGLYTIAEMARTFHVSLRTLRFYEARGLLKPERRGTTRLYSTGDGIRLQLVLKGKRLGFSLAEIERILQVAPSTDHADADAAKSEIVDLLEPDAVRRCLNDLEDERSRLEQTINELRGRLA